MKIIGLILLSISVAIASRDPYIIGGIDAEITEYPFMVSIQSFGSHGCGASLFDSTHVITAAHCVDGSSPAFLSLMMGTNSQENPEDGGEVAYYDVAEIYVHEDYSAFTLANDIALLYIDGEVAIDGVYVQPIDLAQSDAEDFVGADCDIIGWGRTDNTNFIYPDILKYAPANVISTEDCMEDQGGIVKDDRWICIRDDSGEQGNCHGDSGGPMACIDSTGNRVLAGLTSGGDPGCDTSISAFDTRISAFYDWVQDNL